MERMFEKRPPQPVHVPGTQRGERYALEKNELGRGAPEWKIAKMCEVDEFARRILEQTEQLRNEDFKRMHGRRARTEAS
jgi:hypothetical protein